MSNLSTIQWFPGHMAKTKRLILEKIKFVDLIVEIIDARIPISSRNPIFLNMAIQKKRILLLNKSDLADFNNTNKWISFFKSKGLFAVATDCRTLKGIKNFIVLSKKMFCGQNNIKILACGIPNVGKSSFINRMMAKNKAKVENRPSVTRALQWYRSDLGFDILDTPGVLWPKFDDLEIGENLAIIGSIKYSLLDNEALAISLIKKLINIDKNLVEAKFKINISNIDDPKEILILIGRKRGAIKSKGKIDEEKVANIVLNEFRSSKFGRVSLEKI
ncbi:MAG: ribosome biogenesis GTPase YlqF [Oscillospiraceae bacterium]|nr:ribosome biogenesis GTPase YlqF [Oscillospiraceae bacterium]